MINLINKINPLNTTNGTTKKQIGQYLSKLQKIVHLSTKVRYFLLIL